MTITIIQMSPNELQAMIDAAVMQAVEQAARTSGEMWGVGQVAEHFGVSPRTVRNWEAAGRLPPRVGTRWLRADILRFTRHAMPDSGPTESL